MNAYTIRRIFSSILVCILFLTACKEVRETSNDALQTDPHSYARPAEAVVKHLDLDIEANFEKHIIEGTATLTIEKGENAKVLHLDAKEIGTKNIWIQDTEGNTKSASFHSDKSDPILGKDLEISLEPNTEKVIIDYMTHPHAEALKWLNPQQTAGKKHPFLLTQSQAINARTWIPIQDSPGIRFTYSAKVKVPKDLMAVMSATNPTEKSEDGVYTFKMEQPIPAYLLALAIGDLTFASLGDRTGVYAEPSMLEASTYELGEMEDMMKIAEGLYGPYQWDRYDVIVLPPSFPFGGMENPRLTFATPTIIVGDRSLTSLIAHELAHSWSGNLVTNATWNDFWLNEGFTVYFEYRIMEALKGREYSEMLAKLSFQDLEQEIEEIGKDHADTHLYLELKGKNPDDGVTSIPYDKGYYFLRLIEETVGREKFDSFLKDYFNTNAFKTMTTEKFLAHLNTTLLTPEQQVTVNIDSWVHGPGIPANHPIAKSDKFTQVETAIEAFMNKGEADKEGKKTWTTHEWLHFIRHLPEAITNEQLTDLDKAFDLTNSKNPEIQCAWYKVTLNHQYAAANDAVEAFLIRVGRRKFLTPLYKAMVKTEEGKKMAKSIYAKARPNYHPISTNTLDPIVGYTP